MTYVPSLNILLSLASPLSVARQNANATGDVAWTFTAPSVARSVPVWFQIAQLQRVTNVVETTIEPY